MTTASSAPVLVVTKDVPANVVAAGNLAAGALTGMTQHKSFEGAVTPVVETGASGIVRAIPTDTEK